MGAGGDMGDNGAGEALGGIGVAEFGVGRFANVYRNVLGHGWRGLLERDVHAV